MEANKQIKIYGTLVNHTLDRSLSDNTHNDAIAYAYQLYDERFLEIPVQENFQDNINKRVTAIKYNNGVTTIENRDGSKGNPYMLIIKGHTNIEGDLHIDNLYIEDGISIGGDLTVNGDTHLKGDLQVDGDTNLNGSLDVFGDTHLHQNLQVDGDTNIKGDTVIEGSLTVKNNVTAPNITEMQQTIENLQQTVENINKVVQKIEGLWKLENSRVTSIYPAEAAGFYDSTI